MSTKYLPQFVNRRWMRQCCFQFRRCISYFSNRVDIRHVMIVFILVDHLSYGLRGTVFPGYLVWRWWIFMVDGHDGWDQWVLFLVESHNWCHTESQSHEYQSQIAHIQYNEKSGNGGQEQRRHVAFNNHDCTEDGDEESRHDEDLLQTAHHPMYFRDSRTQCFCANVLCVCVE